VVSDRGTILGLLVNTMKIGVPTYGRKPLKAPAPETVPEKDWTLLYVLNGDNDLREAATLDLVELDRMGTPKNVAAVCQLYRGDLKWSLKNLGRKLSSLGSAEMKPAVRPDWRGMKVFEVRSEDSGSTTQEVGRTHFAEPTTPSDPKALTDFVAWGMEAYPARHYAVILGGHGSLDGVMSDARGEKMTFADAAQALKAASERTGRTIDTVLLDSCATASEQTAQAFQGATQYLVASPEVIRGGGWSESETLEFLKDNPQAGAREFAQSLVEGQHPGVNRATLYATG